MKWLRCFNCGYDEERETVFSRKCPNCGNEMDVEDNEFDDELTKKIEHKENILRDIIEKDMIMAMENNILSLGHKRSWEIIEAFKNPKTRLGYRKLFLKAGGNVPEKEI